VNKNHANFKQTLKRLLGQTSGLCYVADLEDRKANLSDEERIHLLKARDLKATAVFFRKFQNRPSIPQAYIYDHTEKEFSLEEKGKLHKFIWNSGVVPIFILFQKTKVEIYNSTKKVILDNERKPKAEPYETLNFEETIGLTATAQKIQNLFSSLENGTFWDEAKNQKFIDTESAYSSLLKELKTARVDFIKEIKLSEQLANKLLLIAILIKYLEERTGADNKPILYFKKYDNAKDFCQVIEKNKFLDLLNDLSEQMNGKVFELSSEEFKILKKANLKPLVEFLSAKKDGKQYVFWALYSFNHLPVELISGIYEEFLPEEKGTIYTPLQLVQLLIDQSMPLHKPQPDLKILDPACGSGIFLVSAFKRKVEWWKIQNYKKTGEFKNPDLKTLKRILKESIFGIDIKEEAVKIAIFSLSIALCDYLEPTKIWTELRFDDLSEKNILAKNFFTFLKENKSSDFDLIIGNPPFKNFDKDESRDEEALKIHNKELEQKELTSPGKQIAYLFLKYSMNLLKPDGLLCLVMPSHPLLYNNTLSYRNKTIFEKYNVPQILDFTFLDNSLFT
jgi:methylase of polypeptide subunit release factors